MILATVGAQMPFPRLVSALDDWARANPAVEMLVQIGDQDPPPASVPHIALLDPETLRDRIRDAELTVAHAGMGTIITCLELGAPLVIFPRDGDQRETRNNHQIDTARRFGERDGIWVADDAAALHRLLDDRAELRAGTPTSPQTSPRLIAAIREFIDG
ncbi:MAG: glycosyltransferase [Acidimicrobiales bacterium]